VLEEASAVTALDVKLQPAEAKRGSQILHLFDRVNFAYSVVELWAMLLTNQKQVGHNFTLHSKQFHAKLPILDPKIWQLL